MANKPTDETGSGPARSGPTAFPEVGKVQTDAMLNMHKDLLETYEQASRTWLARVKSEMDLWSELASKITTTRSLPEAMTAYQECVAQRMRMAAEDGRRLSEECQQIMQKVTRSFSGGGWPGGGG